MTGIVGIHHVQVAAPLGCEEAARAFYGALLGLPEIEKPLLLAVRGGCWFRAGTLELHVGVTDPFTPATKAHPALLVGSEQELEELAERIADSGGDSRWADDGEIPGQRRFHTTDPWGNRVEFIASVARPYGSARSNTTS